MFPPVLSWYVRRTRIPRSEKRRASARWTIVAPRCDLTSSPTTGIPRARNRSAQANYSQPLIAEKRLKLEQARAEQAIEAQVRNALQAIQTAKQRIAASEASERAAKEKLESETRLFQTGESTNFLVLTRQNEYLDSRRRSLVAHLDLNKALSRMEQAVGNTLETHSITVR